MAVDTQDRVFEGLVDHFEGLAGTGYAPEFDGYIVDPKWVGRSAEPRVVILSDNPDARRFRGIIEEFVAANAGIDGDGLDFRNAVSSQSAAYVQPLLTRMGWMPEAAQA